MTAGPNAGGASGSEGRAEARPSAREPRGLAGCRAALGWAVLRHCRIRTVSDLPDHLRHQIGPDGPWGSTPRQTGHPPAKEKP
jgi:hypothetical protein